VHQSNWCYLAFLTHQGRSNNGADFILIEPNRLIDLGDGAFYLGDSYSTSH
jgi:hypothetical protein